MKIKHIFDADLIVDGNVEFIVGLLKDISFIESVLHIFIISSHIFSSFYAIKKQGVSTLFYPFKKEQIAIIFSIGSKHRKKAETNRSFTIIFSPNHSGNY